MRDLQYKHTLHSLSFNVLLISKSQFYLGWEIYWKVALKSVNQKYNYDVDFVCINHGLRNYRHLKLSQGPLSVPLSDVEEFPIYD